MKTQEVAGPVATLLLGEGQAWQPRCGEEAWPTVVVHWIDVMGVGKRERVWGADTLGEGSIKAYVTVTLLNSLSRSCMNTMATIS